MILTSLHTNVLCVEMMGFNGSINRGIYLYPKCITGSELIVMSYEISSFIAQAYA